MCCHIIAIIYKPGDQLSPIFLKEFWLWLFTPQRGQITNGILGFHADLFKVKALDYVTVNDIKLLQISGYFLRIHADNSCCRCEKIALFAVRHRPIEQIPKNVESKISHHVLLVTFMVTNLPGYNAPKCITRASNLITRIMGMIINFSLVKITNAKCEAKNRTNACHLSSRLISAHFSNMNNHCYKLDDDLLEAIVLRKSPISRRGRHGKDVLLIG